MLASNIDFVVSLHMVATGTSYSGMSRSSGLLNSKSIIHWSSDIKTGCSAVDSEAKTQLFPQSAQNQSW